MRPRRRRISRPQVVGVPVVSGCGCARSNGDGLNEKTPLLMFGGMAVLFGGMMWFAASITKDEREARAEKDRAVAKALRDGTLSSYTDMSGPRYSQGGYGY